MSNGSAERLRSIVGIWNPGKDGKTDRQWFDVTLDAALAAERRATVERIRAALHSEWPQRTFHEILDAEAK